jgi:uncharacterized protein YdcH (DUF465 family)
MSSKKHLSQVNNVVIGSSNSVTSSITEPEYNNDLINKIKDLENELKLKDIEIENLKSQIKMKDEFINILRTHPQEGTKPPTTLPITKKPSSKQVIENLEISRKDAPTIQEYLDTECYNDEINKAFKGIQMENKSTDKLKHLGHYDKKNNYALVPKTTDGILPYSSYSNLIINVFCGMINNTEKHLCPIYCSDVKRKVFYVKTDEGWKKFDDDEFHQVQEKIIKRIDNLAYDAQRNARILCQYHYSNYKKVYPYGLSQYEDKYEPRHTYAYTRIWTTYNDDENETQMKTILGKHLRASLSEITSDNAVKFKPKEEHITIQYEEKSDEESCEESCED